MHLPVPIPEEVESFKALFKEQFGEELDTDAAKEAATRVLQLYFLKHYEIHSIQPEE